MLEANKDLLHCLEFIARRHGRDFSESAVIAGLPVEGGSLSPSLFSRAASRLQLASQVVKRDILSVNPALLPAVVLLKGNKACVVCSIDRSSSQVEVVYPELNGAATQVSIVSLQQHASGIVIYCRPEFDFDKRADDSVRKTSHHWFWGAIRESRKLYRDVILAALLINILALAMPLFVMNVYDRVVPNQATATLWVLAAGAFIAITADMVLRLMRSWYVDLAANRTDVKVSSEILHRVLGMRLTNAPLATGSFISSVQGFESVRSFFSSFAVNSLVDLPFVLFFLGIIAIINPYLALPIVIGIAVVLIYALMTQHKLKQLSEDSMRAGAMRNATLVESVGSLPLIKAFNGQGKIQSVWEKSTIYISRVAARSRMLSGSLGTVASWVQQTVAISIILIGVYLVIGGNLTVGGIIAAYLLSSRAMAPIAQASSLIGQYHQASTVMSSLNDLMDRETEEIDNPKKMTRATLRGEIEFSAVDFNYEEEGPGVLRDVSFYIKPGEKVAILGRNGSGKSSIARLILGLYSPTKGQVKIDGVDINQLNLMDVRRNIGYLPQDAELMFGSLQDNITMPALNVSAERLMEVSNLVGLGSMIDRHPEGLNMSVQERGRNLSGGQRQVISLARALINDPPIIVLDEPTGALDHSSEALVKNSLENVLKEKTGVIITHKTAMLDLVDRIIVIDAGRKVADGKKEDVLEALRQGRVGTG